MNIIIPSLILSILILAAMVFYYVRQNRGFRSEVGRLIVIVALRDEKIELQREKIEYLEMGPVNAAKADATFFRAKYERQTQFVIRGETAAIKLHFRPEAIHVVIYRELNALKLSHMGGYFEEISKQQFDEAIMAEKKKFYDVLTYLNTLDY